MQDRVVPTEAEKWELKRQRSMAPTQPMDDLYEEVDEEEVYAGKAPVYHQVDDEEEVDDEGEEPQGDEPSETNDNLPNLHEYFQNFDVTDEKVISMCRAYASYLSSLRPKKTASAYATPRRRSAAAQGPPSQKQRYWEAKRKRK